MTGLTMSTPNFPRRREFHAAPRVDYRAIRPGVRSTWWFTPLMVLLPLLAFVATFLWGGNPAG